MTVLGNQGFRTVCSATAAEDGIAAGAFDRGYDGARGSGAFDEDKLVFQVRFNLIDSCRGVSCWVWNVPVRCLPSRLFRELETDFTQPSQVIGTEKVV
jgi:spore germination protein YaaH